MQPIEQNKEAVSKTTSDNLELFKKYHQSKVFDKDGNLVSYDKKLRNELVVKNIKLVTYLVNKFYGKKRLNGLSQTEREDLQQDGIVGLFEAIDGFDPTKGFMFSTYATWWVRQACRRTRGNSVHVPPHITAQLNKIKKKLKTKGKTIDNISYDEVSDEMTEKMFNSLKMASKVASSVDSAIEHENDFADENYNGADEISDCGIVKEAAKRAYQKLSTREKIILLLRFNIINSPKEFKE